jgi:hypothetical protein
MDGKLTREEFLAQAERAKDNVGEEQVAKLKEFLGKVFDKLDNDNKGYLKVEQFKKWGEIRENIFKK